MLLHAIFNRTRFVCAYQHGTHHQAQSQTMLLSVQNCDGLPTYCQCLTLGSVDFDYPSNYFQPFFSLPPGFVLSSFLSPPHRPVGVAFHHTTRKYTRSDHGTLSAQSLLPAWARSTSKAKDLGCVSPSAPGICTHQVTQVKSSAENLTDVLGSTQAIKYKHGKPAIKCG